MYAYEEWFDGSPDGSSRTLKSIIRSKIQLFKRYPLMDDRMAPPENIELVGEGCEVCDEDAKGPLRTFIKSMNITARDVPAQFPVCELPFMLCIRSVRLGVRRPEHRLTGLPDLIEGYFVIIDPVYQTQLTFPPGGSPLNESLYQLKGLLGVVLMNAPIEGTLSEEIGNLDGWSCLQISSGERICRGGLRVLNIDRCPNISGPLPSAIASLKRLRGIYIDKTPINGTLPPSFHQLFNTSLESLSLINTDLDFTMQSLFNHSPTGPPPPCRTLRVLRLAGDNITGRLTGSFDHCRELEEVDIRNSRVDGPLPALNLQKHLTVFRLQECRDITGVIPPSYGNNTKLEEFEIVNLPVSGPIPDSFNHLKSLRQLIFRKTKLSKLPATLEALQNLHTLELESNTFTGLIPAWISKLSGLHKLRLGGNDFMDWEGATWKIPPALEHLDASRNKLPRIPPNWRRIETVRRLFLSGNRIKRIGSGWGIHDPGLHTWRIHDPGLHALARPFPSARILAQILKNPPPYWPTTRYLSLGGNQMNMTADQFLMPWKYNDNMHEIFGDNNSLHGALTADGVAAIDMEEVLRTRLLDTPPFRRYKKSFMAAYRLQENATSMSMVDPNASDEHVEVDDFDPDKHVVDVETLPEILTLDYLMRALNLTTSLRVKKGFNQLQLLNLEKNSIQEIRDGVRVIPASLVSLHMANNSLRSIHMSVDRPLGHVDLRNNLLRSIDTDSRFFSSDYVRLTENSDLRFQHTNEMCISLRPIKKCQDVRREAMNQTNLSYCPDTSSYEEFGMPPLVADPQGYSARIVGKGEKRFECTEFCAVPSRIEVDYTFAPDVLCRCLPGYAGTGINCTKCPPGTYSNRRDGTQTCRQCPDDAGSDEGSKECYCRLGHQRGEEPCEPCTAGSIGVRKGGADGSRSAWTCRDCLPGLNCSVPINYNASVLPGFFQLTVKLQSDRPSHNTTREVTTYGAGLTSLPIVMSCPLPSACKGTNKTDGLNICSEGHEGFVCSRCKAGFPRQTPQQPCAPCTPLWQIVLINVLLVLATLMAIFILTALAERASSSPRAEVPSQLIKIGLSHITAVCGLAFLVFDESILGDQISSLIGSFFAWTGGVPQSYQIWECLLKPYVGDKCVLYRNAVWLALPLVWLTAVPIIASGFDRVRDAFKSRRRVGSNKQASLATDTNIRALSAPPSVANGKADTPAAQCPRQRSVTFQEDFRPESVTPPSCQHSLTEAHKSGRWRQWLDNRGTIMVVILTFIHPTVTKSMLALLRCRPFPYVGSPIPIASGESVSLLPTDPMHDMRPRMDLDSHVLCGSAEHAPFLWVAVAGLLLWTLAPVVCGVAFLWRHRDRLQDYHTRRRVGFMYAAYRKNFYYWDFVLVMRRVLVLLIAQQATAQPRQQLLGWTVVASVCLALQFAVWPFDRGNMDILNRSELRGLLVWFVSLLVMQFVVMLPEGTSLVLPIGLVLVVILANLAHYILLAAQICRYGLLQVGYRYTALTDREKAIARVMSGRVTGPLLSWLINKEEEKRRISPKVFYDWSSAALSADGPPAASGVCHPSFGWPVHRAVTAMQLTSAAMQDATERLKLTHVPSDL
ncbi:unnamed protein product [Vitrella brassicaformis CCMP3155]|uniref:EGF-like domain-containing protein n=2 Tax=Vitrella brassicaformis TaxID=1169539 RepID=A0A0G4EKZ5_VITBC|nr:unnamed protein product [Vitrella brassicaformis CCMP3155]|eukprot:CEL98070.1 unnamed protein product [Vitrella brassicaformis CCMP3155]